MKENEEEKKIERNYPSIRGNKSLKRKIEKNLIGRK